eukprot:gene23844-9398_t
MSDLDLKVIEVTLSLGEAYGRGEEKEAAAVLLKFQGRRDYPLDKETDDWGLTPAQQESYVEQFRRGLEAKEAWKEEHHDYFMLRRFLRARTYDLDKATVMWLNHLMWIEDFTVDTILVDFQFHERDNFIEVYPQGYHKIDKIGRPVYIQKLGKINMAMIKKTTTEERMLKFHIQEYERCRKIILPICSRLAGRHIDQTFGIMDVKGVGMAHLTGEVKRLMQMIMQYDQDNYPEMLGHICVINAPYVFRMVWSFVKGYIDIRTQQKVEILGPDYKAGLLKWVDAENLPDWLGGTSQGTLQDDKGPWNEAEVMSKIGMDLDDLRSRHLPPPPPPGMFAAESVAHRASSDTDRVLFNGSSTGLVRSSEPPRTMERRADSFKPPPLTMQPYTLQPQPSTLNTQPSLLLRSSTGLVRSSEPPRTMERSSTGLGMESLNESARRSMVRGGSLDRIPAIPEVGPRLDTKHTNLLGQKIAALERLFPPHMDRIKADMKESAGAGGLVTASGRSAPEGSMLHRVEVLEESMSTLLAAQEVSLVYGQQMASLGGQAQAAQASHKEGECCAVM